MLRCWYQWLDARPGQRIEIDSHNEPLPWDQQLTPHTIAKP